VEAKSRIDALALLLEYTKSDSLIKHSLAVEAALIWYACYFNEDQVLWGNTGLLHDFDYEQNPDCSEAGHPFVGCAILREQGYPRDMIEAILGHATYSGVSRRTLLAKTLFACDELAGLIGACVLIRPDRSIHSLEVKSVRKKMRDSSFARAINREDIVTGAEELGIEMSEHIENVIKGMRMIATRTDR
tara:strand:- start:27706 stop:28272 length:567 start_codon:yes stop_codon:yes gene_type:complete